MTEIPIYDKSGVKTDVLSINDDLHFVDGRVSKGKTHYYKGVGSPYNGQFINIIDDESKYSVIQQSDVFYLGYFVVNKNYENKFGIFQEKYQHIFPDFIGTCSVKEGPIVLNSTIFEKSSVNVIDCIHYDKINNQYYYILDYKCGRKKYTNTGTPDKLKELLEYMLSENWNFLWDKTTIEDISDNGLVTDVADIFRSNSLIHKLGTVYSVLYSLGKINYPRYLEFISLFNIDHPNDMYYVFNSAKILHYFNINISKLTIGNSINECYKHIILNYLLQGQNCAHCACNMFNDNGEVVKSQYIQRAFGI